MSGMAEERPPTEGSGGSERAGAASEPTTYNILFVCTGNTCRSPLAAVIARRLLEERDWRHVEVASAGIAASEGFPATENGVLVAEEQGLDLSGHRTRPLTPELVQWADLILGMGPSHVLAVQQIGAEEKAALITDFADEGAHGIPDPFGGDVDAYRRTYRELARAIEAVLTRLEPILSP